MPDRLKVEDVLYDSATSGWLRTALSEALDRDPIDAANDAEILSKVLSGRADDVLAVAVSNSEIR